MTTRHNSTADERAARPVPEYRKRTARLMSCAFAPADHGTVVRLQWADDQSDDADRQLHHRRSPCCTECKPVLRSLCASTVAAARQRSGPGRIEQSTGHFTARNLTETARVLVRSGDRPRGIRADEGADLAHGTISNGLSTVLRVLNGVNICPEPDSAELGNVAAFPNARITRAAQNLRRHYCYRNVSRRSGGCCFLRTPQIYPRWLLPCN